MQVERGHGALIVGVTTYAILIFLPIQGVGSFGSMEAVWAIAFVIACLSKEAAILTGFGQHIIIMMYFLILGFYSLMKMKTL